MLELIFFKSVCGGGLKISHSQKNAIVCTLEPWHNLQLLFTKIVPLSGVHLVASNLLVQGYFPMVWKRGLVSKWSKISPRPAFSKAGGVVFVPAPALAPESPWVHLLGPCCSVSGASSKLAWKCHLIIPKTSQQSHQRPDQSCGALWGGGQTLGQWDWKADFWRRFDKRVWGKDVEITEVLQLAGQAFGLGGQKRTVGRPLVAGSEGGTVPCEADVGRSNSPEKCTLSSSSYFSSSCTQLNSGQPGSPPLCRPKASPGRWARRRTVSCVHWTRRLCRELW